MIKATDMETMYDLGKKNDGRADKGRCSISVEAWFSSNVSQN